MLDPDLQIRANFALGQQGGFVAFGEAASLPDYCFVTGRNTHYEWIQGFSLNGVEVVSGDNQGYRPHMVCWLWRCSALNPIPCC